MYRENTEEKDAAFLKLYDGHDWKWFAVRLKHTDMEYLRKHWSGKKASAPTLEKKHDKYFLRFTYAEEVSLNRTPVKEQTICSVDLGINTDAVCTIMRPDGTILGRKFINFPSDKDRMYRVLGRIRRFQREHGSRQAQGRWAYAKRLNTELGRKIAKEIVLYASEKKADVIVFEYLEMKGKLSGKKKQKLQMWRKRDIQKRCGQQAHRKGIRISRICAWNTSRLAFDGSGEIARDTRDHRLCTFQTGKRYNCDLSASYNIGARYFIREILKPLPETERSLLEAKVPAVKRRTKSSGYSQQRNIFVKQDVKLTEPPDAEPHVRWCERPAAKAASYSIGTTASGAERFYLYQADNDGEWGELRFDFENGAAEIIRLADWDTTTSNIFAKTAIRFVQGLSEARLLKSVVVPFESETLGK